jgi:putative salt-induced outer membrane protein YdiY
MNKWGIAVGVVGLAATLVPRAFAEEERPWKASLELSYLQTGGNSNSQSFLVGGKGERALANAKLSGEFRAIYGETDDVASDKNWFGALKYDRYFNDRFFGYLGERADRNVLSGIEIRYSTQAGVGYDVIKTTADVLKAEGGFGYVRENPIAPFDDLGYVNARVFGLYEHAFAEKTRFTQSVAYLPSLKDSDDYLFKEESAFVSSLTGGLALKISYAIEYDNLPPPGFFKTDRLFKTALLYTF